MKQVTCMNNKRNEDKTGARRTAKQLLGKVLGGNGPETGADTGQIQGLRRR